MSSERFRRTRKIVVRVIVLVLALLFCGVLYDLYFPRTTHMREFDPDEVARLETAMWRSYYDRADFWSHIELIDRTSDHEFPNLYHSWCPSVAAIFVAEF